MIYISTVIRHIILVVTSVNYKNIGTNCRPNTDTTRVRVYQCQGVLGVTWSSLSSAYFAL